MDDYELQYTPPEWNEEILPNELDGELAYPLYIPDDADLVITDVPANVLDIRPKRDVYLRRIHCVGLDSRMKGLRPGERELAIMYQRQDGEHRIKHFAMTREQCATLGYRLLEIAGVEVLE